MKKLKGQFEFVKLKYLLFVFAAAVLAMLPTRVYQLLALVETDTGFFASGDVTVVLIYTLAIIFPLIFMLLSFISKEIPSPKLPTGKNAVLGFSSLLLAAGFIADIISIESKIVPRAQVSGKIFFSALKANISEAGGFVTFLQFVFAIFAVIYFAVFAVSNLNGKASYKEFKILALSPLAWAMVRLVSCLMQAISFIKVSELLFEMFMLVFLMLFFITFARISSGVFTEDSMWGIFGYGLSAALFAALVTVPRIVMLFSGKESVSGHPFNFTDLCVLVFVLSYIFASLGIGFKDGVKTRKSVENVDLPDDEEVVIKSSDDEDVSADDDEEQDVVLGGSDMGGKIRDLKIEAEDLAENFNVSGKKEKNTEDEHSVKEYVSYGAGISAAVETIAEAADDKKSTAVAAECAEDVSVVIGDTVIELSQESEPETEAEDTDESGIDGKFSLDFSSLKQESEQDDAVKNIKSSDDTPETVTLNEESALFSDLEVEAENFDEKVEEANDEPEEIIDESDITEEKTETAEANSEDEEQELENIAEKSAENTENTARKKVDKEIDFSFFDEDFKFDGNGTEDSSPRAKKEHKFFGKKSKSSSVDDEEELTEIIQTVSLADMRKKKKDE